MGTSTFRVASWMFGFLCSIRLFNDLMASFGWTLLERMMSEISKFNARSSRLDDVAFAIWSSRAELDANQLAML